MSKKFTPSVGKKERLDAFVNKDTKIQNYQNQTKKEEIERKQHGYLIRPAYVKTVSYLSTALEMKKWEIVEEALEDYFEKHKDLVDKFDL